MSDKISYFVRQLWKLSDKIKHLVLAANKFKFSHDASYKFLGSKNFLLCSGIILHYPNPNNTVDIPLFKKPVHTDRQNIVKILVNFLQQVAKFFEKNSTSRGLFARFYGIWSEYPSKQIHVPRRCHSFLSHWYY